MASTRKLIEDWAEAGLPPEQATAMAIALADHLDSKVVDQATLKAETASIRADLQVGLAGVRADLDSGLAGVRAELESGLAGVRADLDSGLARGRADLDSGLAGIRAELQAGMATLRAELAALETRLMLRIVMILVVQVGVFWAISKFG